MVTGLVVVLLQLAATLIFVHAAVATGIAERGPEPFALFSLRHATPPLTGSPCCHERAGFRFQAFVLIKPFGYLRAHAGG